jgi:hypothetical protein
VNRQVEHLIAERTADILIPEGAGLMDARDEHGHVVEISARRELIDDIVIEDALLGCAPGIDDRRFARHDNCLFDGPDFKQGVHRRGKLTFELDAVTLDGVEAGSCEGDRINARTQVDDAVLARAVGQRRSGAFDQGVARRNNRDARQNGTGDVLHRAGNRRLGEHQIRECEQTRQRQRAACNRTSHQAPFGSSGSRHRPTRCD